MEDGIVYSHHCLGSLHQKRLRRGGCLVFYMPSTNTGTIRFPGKSESRMPGNRITISARLDIYKTVLIIKEWSGLVPEVTIKCPLKILPFGSWACPEIESLLYAGRI